MELMGRSGATRRHGEVLVNGVRLGATASDFGLVPQEDIVDRNATVKENLEYSAACRWPGEASHSQVRAV